MYGLEDKALIVAGHIEDALGAQDVLAFAEQHVGDPGVELGGIEGSCSGQRDAADIFVMQRVDRAMAVIVVVVVTMIVIMAVIVIVIVIGVVGVAVQEAGIQLQRAVEIEGAFVENFVQRDIAARGVVNLRKGVKGAHARFNLLQVFRRHQISFVEKHDIGKGDLLFGFIAVGQALLDVFGVDHGDNTVELGFAFDVFIGEKGLGDRCGVSKARRFDQDGVELIAALKQGFFADYTEKETAQ